jgi:phytoene dehydrogenase-like protein
MSEADIVVVGGGLAGLAASATAARAGARVTLLERAQAPGGRARSVAEGGYTLNFGPHALYHGGAGRRVLDELGVGWRGGNADTGGWLVRDGKVARMPANATSAIASRMFGLRDKAAIAAAMRDLQARKPRDHDGESLAMLLDRVVTRPKVREFVETIFRVACYADAPADLAAGAALDQLRVGMGGVTYLDGGWQTLVDGLRMAAARAGVKVVTGARVERVAPARDGWAVTTAGSVYRSAAAVLAVAPAAAAQLVGDSVRGSGAWPSGAVPARAAVLDIGLERLPRPGRRFVLGMDRPLYLSVHAPVARLAPGGEYLVSLAKYLAPGAPSRPADDREELEAFMSTVQPGWERLARVVRFLPSMTVSQGIPRPGGRPAVEVAGMRGLYLAGDWVGAEGMIADAALASGQRAGRLAAAHAGRRALRAAG